MGLRGGSKNPVTNPALHLRKWVLKGEVSDLPVIPYCL